MFLSKQIPIFAAIMALAPSVLADCSFSLSFTRTQNPFAGGENTHTCSAEVDYGNGETEVLSEACNEVSDSRCYPSKLANTICVHTNSDFSDGYMDYAAEHRDFNEDGCEKDDWAGIAGDGATTKCTFPC
ncbi:hypothetical protein ASPVEDRAFT_119660 [Aspergillus versicolor CBS 583.65]|uniref:Uncharacterized protein n=1 Tax=Aspergillus versicolor CBS 583.65 TaxID=1036611 RepID=A0A1L9P5H9_ASPVE|nr:uncharacterized protein ASPVEDRAFT_119660 [Aspergillus versicolor CBS 583.65]OJI96752.1 hypothetical protein ASPVEDRAFT_119660 [Aspergillus versicolor CBS 583.65]